MTVPVFLTAEAEADLEEAAIWYEQRANGLGIDLIARVRQSIMAIGTAPDSFQEVQVGIRRAQVKRFPYGLFFRRQGGIVEVIGILHHRRSPTAWKRRV